MALLDKTGISLERLASFLQVSEVGSITRAANGETSRQVLISRQIRDLEAFFGVKLTHRVGRGIELTDAGHELAKRTRECFRSLENFQDGYAGRKRRVLIGAAGSVLESLLIPGLEQINSQNFQVGVMSLTTDELVKRLEDGRIDIAILRENAVTSRMLSKHIGEFGYNLWIPETLYSANGVTLDEQLATIPLALPIGGSFRVNLDVALRNRGVVPKVAVETNSFSQSAEALRTGRLGAILPEYINADFLKSSKRKVSLPESLAPRRGLSLAVLTNRSDLGELFHLMLTALRLSK